MSRAVCYITGHFTHTISNLYSQSVGHMLLWAFFRQGKMGLERLKILPEVAKLVTELGLGSSLFYSKLQMPSSKAAYTSLMGWTDVVSAKSLQWLLLKQSDTFFFFLRVNLLTHHLIWTAAQELESIVCLSNYEFCASAYKVVRKEKRKDPPWNNGMRNTVLSVGSWHSRGHLPDLSKLLYRVCCSWARHASIPWKQRPGSPGHPRGTWSFTWF